MAERQVINTGLLKALNPEYAEALARGEPWALKHAERVESINTGEPEGMRRKFDGKKRKWCGTLVPTRAVASSALFQKTKRMHSLFASLDNSTNSTTTKTLHCR